MLASIHNSLHSADVERGLRAVEEELTHPDQSGGRKGKGGGKGRSFWVEEEEDGEWGIFMGTEMEVEEFVDLNQVHWVNKNPMQDYPTKTQEHNLESVMEDGFWNQEEDGGYSWWDSGGDGEYYHQDISGTYWAWSDWETQQQTSLWLPSSYRRFRKLTRPTSKRPGPFRRLGESWLPKEPTGDSTPQREVEKESSKERKARGNLRFCQSPFVPAGSVLAVQQPGQPGYTGCFICGSQQHDFRHCPRRGKGKGGKSSGSYFVGWASSCCKRSRSSWRREVMETSGSTRT